MNSSVETTRRKTPRISRGAKKVLAAFLATALAFMMVPFIPANPLGDYDIPAYASDGDGGIYDNLDVYIASNLDEQFVHLSENEKENPSLHGKIYVQQTIVDENMMEGYTTLDDIYDNVPAAVAASYPSYVNTYDTPSDNEYYYAFIAPAMLNNSAQYLESTFNTWDEYNPINLDDQLVYDSETGILYIPKTLDLSALPEDEQGASIQAQITYTIPFDESQTSLMTSIDLEIENNNPHVTAIYKSGTIEDDTFDITTTFPVVTPDTAGRVTLADFEFYVDGEPDAIELVEGENAIFDQETGELTVCVSPINISSVKVVINNAPERANAVTTYGIADLWALPNTLLQNVDIDTLANGQCYHYWNSMTYSGGSTKPDKASRDYMFTWSPGAIENSAARYAGDLLHNYRWSDATVVSFDFFAQQVDALGSAYGYGLVRHNDIPAAIIASGYVPSGQVESANGVVQDFGPSSAWGYSQLCGQCSHSNVAASIVHDPMWSSTHQGRVDGWQFMRILAHGDDYMIFCFQFPINNSQQAAGIYKAKIEGSGYAKINKSSTNTQITDGNKQYDLAGAYYDIYTEEACVNKVGEIGPTDSNGDTNYVKLKKGTYWVKERAGTVPKGYLLDTKAYSVTVEAGKETTVSVQDKPSGSPPNTSAPNAGFTIVKRDYNRQADGTKIGAQGAGSLQAVFKVTYLNDFYDSVETAQAAAKKGGLQVSSASSKLNKISYIPTRLQADGTYRAAFDVEHLEADDSTAANPKYQLAIGTYLVEEVTPGDGYKDLLLNPSDDSTAINSKTAAIIHVKQTENGQAAHVNFIDGTNIDKTCITTTSTGNKAQELAPNSNDVVFTNLIPRGDIAIMKYGERTTNVDDTPDQKVPLVGVQFQIINDNDNPVMNVQNGTWVPKGGVVYTLTTDDQGFATTRLDMTDKGQVGIPNNRDVTGGRLAAGNYLLKELEGPAQEMGYELMEPIPFSIANNYQLVTMTLENKIGTVVSLQKVDAETGNPVRGATKFRILDSNKKPMSFDDFYPSSAKIDTFTTGIDGIAKLPAKFMPGTYYIQEVESPNGYVWSDELIPFTCDTKTVKEHGEYANPMIVEFPNYAAKGVIEITKTDSTTNQPITASPATFKVYAAEDIVTQDGTVRAKQGDLVDTISTGADGKATTKELYLGIYNVVEETAPNGYLLNTATTQVSLTYEGDRVAVVTSKATVADEPVFGTVSVSKFDGESEAPIRYAGVTFDIRAAENITGGDGHVWYKKGETVDTIKTDANGVATSAKKLRLGKYEVVEKSAPYGYVLDDTPVPFELEYADQVTPLVSKSVTVTDRLTPCDIEITKVDRETGQPVLKAGCEIEIIANDNIITYDGTTHYRMGETIDTVVTDETGKITSDLGLPVGKYKLREKNAPEGYVLDNVREYAVELTWDNGESEHQVFQATVSDMPAKGIVTFTKADASTGNTIPVAGIKAQVIANEDIKTYDGVTRAYANEVVADLVTDENGFAQSGELYLGSYRVVETFAPEGYLLNEEPVNVSLVYENQNVPVVTQGSQIEDENAMGVIEVTKIDRESNKTIPLAGAVFEVRAKGDIKTPDGTVRVHDGELACDPITTNDEGKCVTPELFLGTYSIIEINAPTGYTLDSTPVDAVIAYKDQYTAVVTGASSVSNVAQKGVIKVTKTDVENGLPILTSGAKFEITSIEDIFTADGTQRTTAGEVVATIETDDTGIAESPTLYLGKYSIKEVLAPKGYLLTDEVKEVELVYGNQSEPLVYEMASVADTGVVGTILVHKEDSDLHEPLAGVVYEIRAQEDIVDGTGAVHHHAGDVVETVTTDGDGVAESGELRLGKYVVVETVQPNGYELDETEYPVELKYADQVTPVVHEDIYLLNTPSSAKIKKVSVNDPETAVPGTEFLGWDASSEAVTDATFAVFANPSAYSITSAFVDYMGPLDVIAVDAETIKSFELSEDDSIDGWYQVWTSTETPEQGNYVMHISYINRESGKQMTEDIDFSVNEYDTNAFFAMGAVSFERDCANYLHYSNISDDSLIEGEYPNDEGNIEENSTENTDIDLLAREDSETAAGDEASEDTESPAPAEDDKPANDEANDEKAGETTSVKSSGVVVRVPVILTNVGFSYSVTGEDGICEFKYIPQGKVGFAEYKPADGYVSDRTPQYAIYASNGRLESTEINGNAFDGKTMSTEDQVLDLVYADDQTKLQISKQDITNSEELPGNVLSVYEAETPGTVGTDGDIAAEDYGKLIETWTSTNEPHMMELLPQGTYILKEEQAVDGYTIAEDIKFQVNDTGVVQQVVMKNDHAAGVADELIEDFPLPLASLLLTGDLLPKILILMGVMMISAVGVAFIRWRRRS